MIVLRKQPDRVALWPSATAQLTTLQMSDCLMLIILLMSQPQPTHHSNAARTLVFPPLPAQQKKPPESSFKVSKIHARATLHSERQPASEFRLPGSSSVECGENRNSRGKHVSTGQLWQWRCRPRTCLVCFVSVNTSLALVPTV